MTPRAVLSERRNDSQLANLLDCAPLLLLAVSLSFRLIHQRRPRRGRISCADVNAARRTPLILTVPHLVLPQMPKLTHLLNRPKPDRQHAILEQQHRAKDVDDDFPPGAIDEALRTGHSNPKTQRWIEYEDKPDKKTNDQSQTQGYYFPRIK